jgi:PAS domain S-box-containing protein
LDLFQKNPNPMWIYDSETLQFLDLNPAAVALYGWSREEFLRMTILDIRPVSDGSRLRSQITERGKQLTSGPWRHRYKDGSEHLVRVFAYDIEFESRPARAVLVTDITDSVNATEALRQSEEIFRGLCASSPTGVYRARIDGYVLYVNPVLAQIWQMPEEEILGFNWMRRVHPEDLHPLLQGWLTANTAGQSYEHIFRLLLPSGEIRWIHGRSSVVNDAAGEPVCSVGTIDDVTQQRGAEDALRMSEAELRTLTDKLPVALLYVDARGRCCRANHAFEEWFDISRREIVQLDFEHFILRGDGKEYEAEVRHAWALARQGVPSTFEKRIKVHGRQRIMEASYTPDTDSNGNVCGVIVLLHDITERRELEEQFRQAQKMEAIGRLAGGIAHDFNNILSIMNGYAGLLQQELEQESRLGRMSGEIYRAGERAARLTQQLLAFSRKQISQPRIVRLDDILRDDETMLRRLLSSNIRLELSTGCGDACVEIDPSRLSQVLLNLAINARDAMPNDGTLAITSWITDDHAFVSVKDNGCGMPPEVKQRLFEPFFTTKEVGKGTGLGLATAYGIIREAGGNIAVESAIDSGSTFTLSLPMANHLPSFASQAQLSNGNHHGTETILLMEDDPNIRFLLAHTLKSCGYTVVQAEDGLEGLQLAQTLLNQIDAIVSDAIMPRMSGQEVIASLRQSRPELKAMIVSGHVDADPLATTGNMRTSFLYKPVSPETLASELRRLLDSNQTTA